MRLRVFPLALVAFALELGFGASPARASDPAAAEALYRAGKEAAKKGDWQRACVSFAESQRLEPAPGTLLNLADCEEHRGLVASAWSHYTEAATKFRPGDARIVFAKGKVARLEKRLPRLTVRLDPAAPPEAKVFRDDVELALASLGVPLPIDPGRHLLVVRIGAIENRQDVETAEGTTTEVVLSAPAPLEEKAAAPPAGASEPAPATSGSAQPPASPFVVPTDEADSSTFGWAMVGTGGIGLGLGAVSGVLALSKARAVRDTCGPDYATCDAASVESASSGKTFATVSTIALAGGALVAGVGLFLVLRSPSSTSGQNVGATRIGLGPVPGGGGAVVGGAF